MTVNGTTGGASVRPGHFQRPFSPIGRIPSPPALSQQMTALQKNRHAESPDTFAQKSDSPDHETLRATGTGSMDEPGVPTMAKITAERPKNWYKVMFQQIHKVEKQDPPVPVSPVVSHVTPEAKTSWSQSKIKSDSTGGAVTDPCPVLPSAARAPSLTPQKKDSGGDRVMSEIKQLGHPGRKVDTGKYSAEPSKVTQCEPVMASASEEERPVHDSYAGDIDLENEPWYKFFSQLEFGRPPPKKRLDYGAEDSPRGLSVSSLNQSPENRIPEGPASSSCDYWKRLISEPSVGLQSWLMDDQSSRRPGDPQENDSAQRKLSTGPSTPLTSRYQEKDSFRGFLLPTIEQYTLQSRWRMAEREKRLVKALYDFKAQRPRELTFKKGDILYVSRQVNGSWYEGELQGQLGIFPISYVERVRVQEKKPPARPPPPAEMQEMGEAVARYTFVANNNAELSLRKGERVVLLRRVDQNWYEGQIPETGRRGIFPVSYVNVIKKGSTKSLAQCAEPLVTQNYPSSKPASTRPHLNSPSPTPRHHALQSPTPTLAHLQGVNSCGSWISFPAGLSPSSTPAPTPPPFPTNLLPNAALDSRESPTPLSHLPALREGHFIPITSARALRGSPEFSSSPNLAMSSYTSSSPASPMFDCSYGYGGSDVFLGKCADLEDSLSTPLSGDMGVIDAEPSASLKSNVSGDLMANELRQRSTFDEALSFVKSQEEDICEELLSFIQGNQLRRRFTEENRFGTQASDLAEELPKLYIEEEPCENSEDTKACDPLTRARGESAKQEQVTDSLVSPVEPPSSSSPSSQLPALSHPTESKQLPPSPCSTPPLPGITQSSPISSKYSPRLESRSPKIKPALKRDLIIVGKPPRSPVMSRRSCGSPVRGQSFSSSHRRAALVQDALQSGGEPFRVLYNYTPHNEDELELAEGDVVDVMEKCDDGWFVGISRRSKLFGTFPGNYVKRL